jgi:hypothetical protein
MKILYYIASIGSPDIETKLSILEHNLAYIKNNINNTFDIILNCYNNHDVIYNFVKQYENKYIINIFTYNKPGVLTELWLTNPHNIHITNYDYMLFMLDDVKIINLDIYDMVNIKQKYNVTIMSPKVIKSTHRFMNQYDSILTLNNALEIYCLLLTPDDFVKYSSINSIENKWMWGVDFMFGFYNICAGVYNKYSVEHMLPSKSRHKEACILMHKYLKNIGYKNSICDIIPIKEIINI